MWLVRNSEDMLWLEETEDEAAAAVAFGHQVFSIEILPGAAPPLIREVRIKTGTEVFSSKVIGGEIEDI